MRGLQTAVLTAALALASSGSSMISGRTFASVVVVAALACVAARSVSAHHSFSAEFDVNKCGEYTGTLTGVDWQNPHAYFFLESRNAKGVVEKLTFQTSSLANMIRGGTPRGYFMPNHREDPDCQRLRLVERHG